MMMKVKFTQFFDICSDSTKFTKYTVTAGGDYIKARCLPQFICYQYYKLGPVTVKCVPASTLPVDPTGLSYEAGETTVDPRDMFNPGLVRITNGEPVADLEKMETYYATMLDPRWFKFQLQQGFTRTAKPLVYNIGEIGNDVAPFNGMRDVNVSGIVKDFYREGEKTTYTASTTPASVNFSEKFSPIQTGRVKLGWMPTNVYAPSGANAGGVYAVQPKFMPPVPEIDLITFVLPKAFKTKFYYRVFVESTVYFKGPVAVNPVIENVADIRHVYTPIDRGVSLAIASQFTDHSHDIGKLKIENPLGLYGGAEDDVS